MSVTVGDGGAGAAQVSGDGVVAEGAPVVNQRGELVALCTHDADGVPHLVVLESLDEIRQAMAAAQGAAPVWLGVVINDDPSKDLSVASVDPAGPAAAAGLEAGDVIVAADGRTMADCDALIAYLANLQPGDVVRLTVRGADGGRRDVDVELARPKTTL
jgi:S1-C subfamily serine protease